MRHNVLNVEVPQAIPSPPPTVSRLVGFNSAPGGTSLALDQWRGMALVLVLISHGFYFTGRVHGIGRVGVNLFFFISGVLVFRSLANPGVSGIELAMNFWRRRVKRLYPALAAYLVAMLPVVWFLRSQTSVAHSELGDYLRGLPLALTYTMNYAVDHGTAAESHLWSLSCEMQFYLLAPLIFLLGGRAGRRRNWIWGTVLAVLLLGGALGPFVDRSGKYRFEQAVWPMMLGFWCEYQKAWFQRIPVSWITPVLGASGAIMALSLCLMLIGGQMLKLVVACGALALIPCFLAYVHARDMPGIPGRLLAWLGERTYSIYLWQQPFTICGYLPAVWHWAGAVASTLVGGIWFRLFERPFLSNKRTH